MARKATEKKRAEKVKTRDNYICRACGFGGSAAFAPYLECDHILAKKRGGADTETNLQCLCKACNGQKLDRFDHQFSVRSATQPEEIWAQNQKVMAYAFAAKTKSECAKRLRKLQ